jgi:hypothetical protein
MCYELGPVLNVYSVTTLQSHGSFGCVKGASFERLDSRIQGRKKTVIFDAGLITDPPWFFYFTTKLVRLLGK